MFVVAIRPRTKEVVIGRREELWGDRVVLNELNWLAEPPSEGETVLVQLRHRAPPVQAQVEERGGRETFLRLLEPRFAVTPGQSGVLFSGDQILGGGRIVGPAPSVISTSDRPE
jgi:tRNA-specific 2-thiouridylase